MSRSVENAIKLSDKSIFGWLIVNGILEEEEYIDSDYPHLPHEEADRVVVTGTANFYTDKEELNNRLAAEDATQGIMQEWGEDIVILEGHIYTGHEFPTVPPIDDYGIYILINKKREAVDAKLKCHIYPDAANVMDEIESTINATAAVPSSFVVFIGKLANIYITV